MKVRAGIVLILATQAACAEIYVCEDNGKKSFSQQPCGSNAKVVEVSSSVRKIRLSEDQMTAEDSEAMCKLLADALGVAIQLDNRANTGQMAERTVYSYLRERIVDFDKAVRRNPALAQGIQGASQTLVRMSTQFSSLSEDERKQFHYGCMKGFSDLLEKQQGQQRVAKKPRIDS